MSVIAVCSLHGAPGATTLAVGLAASTPDALLVEADPSGGVLAARCGLMREPGLVTFAADRAAMGLEGLRRHAQVTQNGLAVLPCPESAEHSTMLLRAAAQDLANRIGDALTVVDVGRLGVESAATPLVEHASVLVIATRPTVDSLAVLAARLPSLQRVRPVVVLVGDRPYGPPDVASELGVDVVTAVAFDPRAADELWSGRSGRALGRSAWARSVRVLARDLEPTTAVTAGEAIR